jgi:signal peptidase II
MIKLFIKYGFMAFLLIVGCYLDFYSKSWAKTTLKQKPPITVIKGVMDVGFTENSGMVFGILNNAGAQKTKISLLIVRIVIVIGVSLFIFLKRKEPLFFLIPLILIVAGAWGNIHDQITTGHVIDFIHIHGGSALDWPFFFNLADAYLCVGMGLLLLRGFAVKKQTR